MIAATVQCISAHAHSHDHGGHGHSHGVSAETDRTRLTIALGLIVGFMLVEVAVGLAVGSLALISDAAHMLTDAAAIGLSLVAIRLAARPAHGALTFGLKRVEILAAQFNGATLLILGVVIVIEGVSRLLDPRSIDGLPVVIVAVVGAVVNLIATFQLAGANRESLNVEGAYQHLLTDLFAFVATAIAGGVILATGFDRADGIASLLIAATMLHAAYGLLRASGRVFLEAAPEGIDPDEIGRELAAAPGIVEVHDLHVWEVTSGFASLSAHVVVSRDANCHLLRLDLETMLHERFGIDHTTIQVDHEGDTLVQLTI